ncbi:MAG: hypothetical protein US76_02460 [Parcubacteria group bacterium GW2011_GWA2_38_13b]|nr:MAG: hypothetical protein US76_02460 [Parcubacteria group bacterium GW2011_GWA2_38_13b]
MKKKWIVMIIGLFVLSVAGFIFCFWVADDKDANKYNVVTVTKNNVVREIKDDGIFNPVIRVEVGSKISGNVTEIFVKEGDLVKKGDVLAIVESALAKKKLEKFEARLEMLCRQTEGIKITITANLRHLEQNRKLSKEGVVSKEDFWKAEDDYFKSLNDLELIISQMDEALADLGVSKIDLENSFVRSSIDGIVLAKYVEMGQTVSAGFSVHKMFDVCSPMSELNFFAKVNSIDFSAVRVGQKIKINVNTAAGIKGFYSIISEKHDNPILENSVPVYNAIAKISNQDLELKPGMTGKFFITVAEKNNVLTISADSLKKALIFSGENGNAMILTGDRVVRSEIETGLLGDKLVEISGKIKEGDLIITGNKNFGGGNKAKTSPWQSKTGGR